MDTTLRAANTTDWTNDLADLFITKKLDHRDGSAWELTVRRGDPIFVFGTLFHFLQIRDGRTVQDAAKCVKT